MDVNPNNVTDKCKVRRIHSNNELLTEESPPFVWTRINLPCINFGPCDFVSHLASRNCAVVIIKSLAKCGVDLWVPREFLNIYK